MFGSLDFQLGNPNRWKISLFVVLGLESSEGRKCALIWSRKYIFKSVFQHHSKFLFGGLRNPPPSPPPSFAAYAIVLLLLRKSETLLFGILLGCLHYYRFRHRKIWRNFWVPSPFKPNIFSFDPPLKHVFFHGPPSNPTSNPPYLIILERSLRRFILLIRYCIHETKL